MTNILKNHLITYHYSPKKALFFLILYSMILIPLLSIAQPFPKPPQPWREAYNISLKNFTFSHPMTVINQEELAIIKYRISNNIEPQKSAYEQLISEAAVQLSFEPDAPILMDIMGGYEPNSNLSEMREWLWRNCHAAYTCGLAYALTDDPIYAEKAKEVLMDWANTATIFMGGDRGLQLGSWFSPMLYAADLIHHYSGWSAADRAVFKSWWRNNCVISGDVLDVMRRKDNNWKDAGILGMLSAAVVLEDTLYLKEALIQLRSYFFTRTDEYVRIPGSGWKITWDENGVYLPREVVRNDGSSGLTYTAYALTTMVQCFEIARYAGFNYWHYTTEDGASIEDVINQYYAWDIKNEPFPWNSNPKKTDKRRNSYELANTFLNVDPELKNWVINHWPQLNGREGDEYCTLNKGDLQGSGIVPPNSPSLLSGTAVSSSQINLTWKDNSTNEEGFKISRKEGSSSYFLLAVLDSNTTSFNDAFFLSPGVTYTYRLRAFSGITNSNFSNELSVTTLNEGENILIINPSDDAYIRGGMHADNNYGDATDLLIGGANNADSVKKCYLKFDIAGSGIVDVKSAVIRLYNNGSSMGDVIIHRTSEDWNENSITWANAPEPGNIVADMQTVRNEQFYEWDITSYILSEISEDSVVSLMFSIDSSAIDQMSFISKERGTNIPELKIINDESSALPVLSENKPVKPERIDLEQNYPNPFNPTTVISWQVGATSKSPVHVELTVYNMLGQKVTTLVSEKQPAGYHEVEFNGQNLSSGVYVYQLNVGDPESRTGLWQDVKRMILLK